MTARLLILLWWISVAVVSSAGERVPLPDPTKGEIDGQQAMIVYASREGAEHGDFLPPENCTYHLVDESGVETVKPCGTWFLPPGTGRYVTWVETGEAISPHQTVFIYRPAPFHGAGSLVGHVVVPSVEVKLPALPADMKGSTVRVLSVGRSFQRKLDRRLLPVTIRMPAGQLIAGAFDDAGNAFALSRAVDASRGAVTIAPVPPAEGSDVVAILSRPARSPFNATAELQLDLGEGRMRKPDVGFTTQHTFYGFWYGIAAREATLRVTSSSLSFPERKLHLTPNTVATIRIQRGDADQRRAE